MNFFSMIEAVVGPLQANNNCDVTISFDFDASIDVDFVEIYLNTSSARIGRAESPKKSVRVVMSALQSGSINLRPGQKDAHGQDDIMFTFPGPKTIDRELVFDEYTVSLPPPHNREIPRRHRAPNAPHNWNLEVHDGSVRLTWDYTSNGNDLDGFQISVWENGIDLGVKSVEPNKRSYTYTPTKNDSSYRLGVRSFNDVLQFGSFQDKPYFSEWVWADARVGAYDGWPPEGRWQRYEFLPGSGARRDGICAISRIPGMMDVYWTENIPATSIGLVRTAWYTDAKGWSFGPGALTACAANSKVSAVTRVDHNIELFFRGVDGRLQHAYWFNGQGWKYDYLTGPHMVVAGCNVPTLSRIPSHLEAFFVTPDGAVRNVYWNEGQNGWGSDLLAPPGSAATEGKIAAISRIPNSMEIFWVSPAGAVKHAYWYDGTWRTGELAPAGSALKNAIAVASRIPTNMELFWLGPRLSIEHAYYYDGQGWQRDQIAPDGSAMPLTGLAALSRRDSHIEVWWSAMNANWVNAYWNEGQPWARSELPDFAPPGLAFCTNIAAVSRAENTMELFATTSFGTIEDAYIYLR